MIGKCGWTSILTEFDIYTNEDIVNTEYAT